MKKELKKQIVDQIIEIVGEGGSFQAGFSTLTAMPTNALTGEKYRGFNAFWLGFFGCTKVATLKQWAQLGYNCAGLGEKGKNVGIRITKGFNLYDKEEQPDGSIQKKYKGKGFGSAIVYRAEDVASFEDGSPYPIEVPEMIDTTERNAKVDAFIANYHEATGVKLTRNPVGGAFYQPSTDTINMPMPEQFNDTPTSTATENMYSTHLHEAGHSTGHKSRLNRLEDKSKRGYAFEELIAELTAAMLCVELGVTNEAREDHGHYVASWLIALGNDVDYIFKAAAEAQKAVDYIIKAQPENQTEEAA